MYKPALLHATINRWAAWGFEKVLLLNHRLPRAGMSF
jgi:hypothetical protein